MQFELDLLGGWRSYWWKLFWEEGFLTAENVLAYKKKKSDYKFLSVETRDQILNPLTNIFNTLHSVKCPLVA